MFIQQLYTNCLSEAAYYIESDGQAAIIDPLRDIDTYLQLAKERNATIKFIFETHFHADFVSGHVDLSVKTGAPIIYGPLTQTKFEAHIATDNEKFTLGNVILQAIHTPGHTIESTCYLLFDEQQKAHAIFTGDTLFVGDVGRPDLSSGNMDKEELAGIMYDTLQHKILPLADDILVYPAHGAGSSCGKNLGPNTYSTIGEEKKTNYALQPQTKDAFIEAVTADLAAAPKYFAINAQINKEGYESIEKVIENGMQALTVKAFKAKMLDTNVIVLDSRNAQLFTEGFVPSSISIGLEGRFAEWAGSILPFDKPMLLITEMAKEQETIIRLARVGFTKMEGFLKGGFEAWQKAGEKIDLIINVEADELAMDIPFDENLQIIDVRREAEFADGHVKDAINIPLSDITNVALLASIEDSHNNYVHCAGGYRSVIAASIMKKEGIHNIRNVVGGWAKIKEEKKIKIEKDISVLN
jgi:hydroxyacylglutathione hydrolase